jgi:hypothetical protein
MDTVQLGVDDHLEPHEILFPDNRREADRPSFPGRPFPASRYLAPALQTMVDIVAMGLEHGPQYRYDQHAPGRDQAARKTNNCQFSPKRLDPPFMCAE